MELEQPIIYKLNAFDKLKICVFKLLWLYFLRDNLYQWYYTIRVKYHCLSSTAHNFYIENDAEIFPAHHTWKVAEKGFKMAFMMNKLAMINSCEIILEK